MLLWTVGTTKRSDFVANSKPYDLFACFVTDEIPAHFQCPTHANVGVVFVGARVKFQVLHHLKHVHGFLTVWAGYYVRSFRLHLHQTSTSLSVLLLVLIHYNLKKNGTVQIVVTVNVVMIFLLLDPPYVYETFTLCLELYTFLSYI